jgi:hypothetical protein
MSPAAGAQEVSRALPSERRARGFAQVAKHERAAHAREHTGERLLLAESEPPIVARTITQRHGYTHHRTYAGVGTVLHYAGFSPRLRTGLALPSRSLHIRRRLIAERLSLADRTVLRSAQASAGRATRQRNT